MNTPTTLKEVQSKEALFKYAESFNTKKNKTGKEKLLQESKHLYVIYARKSTEDEKRQVQSIEDQVDQCKKYAKQNGLEVVDIVREQKSAKTAGRRTAFQSMIDTIKDGTFYNSILAWHPDRLSRNMKEAGEILDMLDNGVIANLQFSSYTFNNDTAGKMMLSMLFAMAKEFSDKLSDDTKRGIEKTVREGKYCGSSKRGYYSNRSGYYREDKDTFKLYASAWREYKGGKTQREIQAILKEQGIDMNIKAISNFFMDPFYAGIYCYGDQVIDITTVDTKFKPMVSPEDFLMVQRMNRNNPRGWKPTTDYRPFNDFVFCADCGWKMTSGVSSGKSDRYLSVTCGNSKCKAQRRIKGIKPLANTVRGGVILDFVIDLLKDSLKIDRKTYEKAKGKYLEGRNALVKSNNEQIRTLRGNIAKAETEEKKITDRILKEVNEEVANSLSNQCSIIISQKRALEKAVRELEVQNSEYESEAETDFPDYDTFLNFFKNVVTTLEETDDAYLIDQLVKLVLLNTTVGDKKVLNYTLREPFETYQSLKILSGVEDGI